MTTQKITTVKKHTDRFLSHKAFEDYLIKRGFKPELGGYYRSPCEHHLIALHNLQLSLDWLADFDGKTTETLFWEIMR
jgi:hypothetical protein